jgi:hypothetical protein
MMMKSSTGMGGNMGMMMMNDPMMMGRSIRGSGGTGSNSVVSRSNMLRNSMMMQAGSNLRSGLGMMSGFNNMNDMTGNGGFDSSSIVSVNMGQPFVVNYIHRFPSLINRITWPRCLE